MALQSIPSLAFGYPMNFELCGMFVQFIDERNSIVKKLALGVFGGHYLNILVHEIGHSLAFRSIYGRFGQIELYADGAAFCYMNTRWSDIKPTSLQKVIIAASGPLANSIFSVIRAIALRKCFRWVQIKNSQSQNRFYSVILTVLKVQNVLCAIYPLIELCILIKSRHESMYTMSRGSDFMQIYAHGGITAVVGSALILGTISALAIKIMRDEPKS